MDIPLSKVCWRSVTVQCVFYPFCTEVKRTESFNRRLVANCDIIMTYCSNPHHCLTGEKYKVDFTLGQDLLLIRDHVVARCRVRDGSCYRNWRRLKASWNWLVRKQAFLWKHELVDWRSPKLENQLYHCCIVSSAYENSVEKKGGKILKITRLPKAALKIGRISLVAIADMFQAVKHVKRMSWEFPFWKRQIDRRYYPTTTIIVVTWHGCFVLHDTSIYQVNIQWV